MLRRFIRSDSVFTIHGAMPKVKKQKHVSSKAIHPDSRRALQLRRKAFRKDKLESRKTQRQAVVSHKISKLLWFREHVDESKASYTLEDMLQLIEDHLHRLDEELEAIETMNGLPDRHGRQYSSREDTIRATIARERELFVGPGFEAPDLLDVEKFLLFKSWNGDERLLPKIVLRKYRAKED